MSAAVNVASLPARPQTSVLPTQSKSAVKPGSAAAGSKVSFADELFEFMGETEEPAVGTQDPSGLAPANAKAAATSGDQFKSLLPGAQLTTLNSPALMQAVPQAAIDLNKQALDKQALPAGKLPAGPQTVGENHSTRTQPPAEGVKTEKKSIAKPVAEAIKTNAGLDTAKLSAMALQTDVPQRATQAHDTPQPDPQSRAANPIAVIDPVENSGQIALAAPAPTGDLALAVQVKPSSDSFDKPVESKPTEQPVGEPLLTQASADENATEQPVTTEATTSERVALGSSALAHAVTAGPIRAVEEQHKSQSEGQPQSNGEGSAESHLALNTSSASSSKETVGAKSSDFGEELGKVSSEPVKSAHVQLGSEGNKVDIRLVERGGSLSVSVRSTDSALTKALSDHTGELTSHLAADHYKTELWTPSNPNKSNSERGGSPHSGGERQGGSAGDGSNKRQNSQGNSKQNQDPEWVQEFESIPGTFQKRIDYTWPQ